MGATSYQRLPDPKTRRRGGGAPAAERAWAALRRAAAGLAGRLYAARRRWASARSLVRARARGRGRHGKVAPWCGYDSEDYARNFDDGVWKAEEGVFWSAGPSLAACSRLARSVSAVK